MKTKKGKSTLKEVPDAPKSGIIEATRTCTLNMCVHDCTRSYFRSQLGLWIIKKHNL